MDFSVTDFNERLRTIRLREVILAIVIGFVLNVFLVALFPSLGDGDLVIMPLFIFILLFFIWALRGTHGLSGNFSKLFEAPPPKIIRSGLNRNSRRCRYLLKRLPHFFHDRSCRCLAESEQ